MRLRNRRDDGSVSAAYVSDAIARPYGQDAVVAVVWARDGEAIRVLLRDGLRPTIGLTRDASRAPLPEPPPSIWVTELVAGILEDGDRGEAGLRARGAAEVREEAGFDVAAAAIEVLGAGMLPSPGGLAEKFYFVAVEVDPAAQRELAGDGSPMEEGARTRWMELDAAIDACVAGAIVDLKTEAGLRRFRDRLATASRAR